MFPHRWPRLLTTCWVFTLCVVRNKSASCSTDQSWAFLGPEWAVQVLTWSPEDRQQTFFNHKSREVGHQGLYFCTDTIFSDQVSSLWCGLIYPRQLIWLNPSVRLGSSSSQWDSRLVISVRRTESSTVAMMHCCSWRRSCSTRHETTNVCLRSLNGCHILRIWCVNLFWDGMTATLEASSPHTMPR